MSDEEDFELLRAWRDAPRDAPDELLDRRILHAAQNHRRRRAVLPLAAAMAACLVLAFYALRPGQIIAPAPVMPLDTATIGLYEGRSSGVAADSDAMQAMLVRRTPSVASTPTAFSP